MSIFKIITVASKMPEWVTLGVQEYQKRFPRHFGCQWQEIPLKKRNKNSNIDILMQEEAKLIQAACDKGSATIALDVKGKSFTTEILAQTIATLLHRKSHINFVIGGPDGLTAEFLEKADLRWSLSPLTLPHPLVRILLIEQLYRVHSIINHHPYHRG